MSDLVAIDPQLAGNGIQILKMRKRLVFATAVLVTVSAFSAWAQSIATQAEMHSRVQSLYGFSPGKVTDQIRASKSNEMDAFWTEVKSHSDVELPLLRKELAEPDNPHFFFADGSALLLSLTKPPEDRELAAQAFTRVDLSDMQSRQYLLEIHALAVSGTNVTSAALHMLDDPKFQVFLPEHGAYKLDQAACLQVALLPLHTDVWLQTILERSKTEHDETAVKSLLLLLFYAQTDQSDRLIAGMSANPSLPTAIREFAGTILKHEREIGIGKQPSRELETRYREQRRVRMAAVSDEAMDDMDELTNKIARARTPAR